MKKLGTIGQKIVSMDINELLKLLNGALADEWLSYYQYWVGSFIIKGPMRPNVETELKEHAKEEFSHASTLAERIIQLGGTPLLDPKEWQNNTNCGYEVPSNPSVQEILKQNIKGEQCAIQAYHEMLQKIKFSDDPITANMIRKIMEDEVGHEEDLESLLEDINFMIKHK